MAAEHHNLPVPDEAVSKWRSRLLPYRQHVLVSWSSLSFTTSPLSAVAAWAPVHLLIGLLFSDDLPLLAIVGSVLMMTALIFAYLQLAVRFRGISEWSTEREQQYHSICCQLAYLEIVSCHITSQIAKRRETDPWKFYVGFLVVACVISEIGRWLSIGVVMQLCASVVLLIPAALEHGWLKEESHQRVRPALRRFRDNIAILSRHYWQVARSRVERYRAQRNANRK